MSAAQAHALKGFEAAPKPEAIAVLEEIPKALEVTVEDAYQAIKDLMEPGVRYRVAFIDDDGVIFRRFARVMAAEAWIVARPVGDDGRLVGAREKTIVCPIALSLRMTRDEQEDRAAQMVSELAALVVSDEDCTVGKGAGR